MLKPVRVLKVLAKAETFTSYSLYYIKIKI